MRRQVHALLILCTSLGVAIAAPLAAAGQTEDTTTGEGSPWAAVDEYLANIDIDFALSVSWVGTDGRTEPVYQREFGFSADEEIRIASATKWVTAATVMTVVDDGDLSLDTTVADVWPEHAGTEQGSMTLAQLLSHTSGTSPLGAPDQDPCLEDPELVMADCVADILEGDMSYAPGTAFAYGSENMQIAATMAEVASGELWQDLYGERIADPLGLTVMAYPAPNSGKGGAIISNAEDYDLFLEMIQGEGTFRGVEVLSPESVEELYVNRTLGLEMLYAPNPSMKGYGLGLWIDRLDDAGNATLVSSPGAFGAVGWVSLTNCHRGYLHTMSDAVIGTVTYFGLVPLLDELMDCDTPPPPDPETEPRPEPVAETTPTTEVEESALPVEQTAADDADSDDGTAVILGVVAVVLIVAGITAIVVVRRKSS